MINDTTYLILSLILLFLQTLPDWNNLAVHMTLGFLSSSTLIVGGIQLLDSIRSLYKTVRNCFVEKEKKITPTNGIVMNFSVPRRDPGLSSVITGNVRKQSLVSENVLVQSQVRKMSGD